jgi:hypothetical protein
MTPRPKTATLLSRHAKDNLLRIYLYELVFGGADEHVLLANIALLLESGASWNSQPAQADYFPFRRLDSIKA